MEFTIKTGSPAKSRTGILVLGAFADGVLPAPTAAVDAAAEGRISQLLKRGDLIDDGHGVLSRDFETARSKPHPGELVLATLNDGTTVIRRLERGAIDDALVPLSGAAPDRSNLIPVRRAKLLGVVKAQVVRYGE